MRATADLNGTSLPGHVRHAPKAGTFIFPAIVAATIAQNYYALAAVFSDDLLLLHSYDGPIILKVLKDLIYFWIIGAVLITGRHAGTGSPRRPYELTAIAVLSLGLAAFSAIANGPDVAAAGIRWEIPFILLFLTREWVRGLDFHRCAQWVLAGLVVCVAAQCYELVAMPPVFGELLPGIPARTPGIFIAPNSAAFFGCASAACIHAFKPESGTLSRTAAVLALMISALAQSGTGLIAATAILAWTFAWRRPGLFLLAMAPVLALMLFNLDSLTQRDDYVQLSGGGRVDVLLAVLRFASTSLANFGVYTNTANLASSNPDNAVAVDSLVASWIGNFGLLSPFILLLTIGFFTSAVQRVDWRLAMPAVITFVAFSFVTVIFEAFPMNLLLIFSIWACRLTRNND